MNVRTYVCTKGQQPANPVPSSRDATEGLYIRWPEVTTVHDPMYGDPAVPWARPCIPWPPVRLEHVPWTIPGHVLEPDRRPWNTEHGWSLVGGMVFGASGLFIIIIITIKRRSGIIPPTVKDRN